MKRMLFAAALALTAGRATLAADMRLPGSPPAYLSTIPAYNWSGFNIGANGGSAFGNSSWTDPALAATGNLSVGGVLIGGTLGANYQVGSQVFGVGGDSDWANLDGITFNTSCVAVGCETTIEFLATNRGRVRYAWNRVLFYGTAGGAFDDIQATTASLPFMSSTRAGWTADPGLEYGITQNWSAKVEYLFIDLGNVSCGTANCGGTATTVSPNENVVRCGFNYRFGWW
jgi:outer membrane immunogenic protein